MAGQGLAIAMGLQSEFDWKSVGLAAIGGGVAGGLFGVPELGSTQAASGLLKDVGWIGDLASNFGTKGSGAYTFVQQGINAAISNSLTQGLAVATGLQEKFHWQQVAVSAYAAPVGSLVGGWVGGQVSNAMRVSANAGLISGLAAQFAGGTTSGVIRAVHRGGKVDYASIAADAFGNALGNSIADQMKPQASSPYSLAGSGAKLGNGGGSVRLGTGDDVSSLGGGGEYPGSLASADDVAARTAGASAQQVPLRQMLGLFATADDGFSSAQDDMRRRFADVYGDDFGFVQTGGGSNGPGLMRSGGPYRSGSLIELSRNGGRDAAMQNIDDAIAFAGMVGDYRTLGNVMQLRSQVGAMNRELADIDRDLVALGKKPPALGPDMMAPGDGLRVLADKLTERRNFVRLVAYENLGVLRLNEDLSIRDIGKDRLSPNDFLKELGQVAERSVAAWAREADGMASRGELPLRRYFFAGANAEAVAKGDVVDRGYKRDIADWLSNQRVPEGPFGLVSINRHYNDPQAQATTASPMCW